MYKLNVNNDSNKRTINPQFKKRGNNNCPNINEESKNTSTTTKYAIGLGLIALASYCIYSAIKKKPIKPNEELSQELKNVQKLYKEIFNKDISANETKVFVDKYKKIIESNCDDKSFCEKLIEEISKDLQTKKPNIRKFYLDKSELPAQLHNAGMITAPSGSYIEICAFNYKNRPNSTKMYFNNLFHEMQHVKQAEIMYRTDKEKFIDTLVDRFVANGESSSYKKILKEFGGNKDKTIKEIRNRLETEMNTYWGEFKPFAKNSSEYEYGLKLLENNNNYIPYFKNEQAYKAQIIEKSAFEAEEKATKLFAILSNTKSI